MQIKREKLKKIDGRCEFTGTIERFGTKQGWIRSDKTILLKDIKLADDIICDHIWFNYTNGFAKLNLKQGDIVKFKGRVKSYVKGYFGRRDDVFKTTGKDYKISYPTKIYKIGGKKCLKMN